MKTGAEFSECRTHRYALWRIWDESKPLVAFIGLNPSTANAETDDATIESVSRLSKGNRYGGFYMLNCFSYISTDPKHLPLYISASDWNKNFFKVGYYVAKCKDVVFAWGNFPLPRRLGVDEIFTKHYPHSLCLTKNKNGSPGHPLYKPANLKFIPFN